MDAHKRCTCCGQMKPLTDYHRRTASRDGRQPACKPCAIAAAHGERLRTRAKWAEIARQNAEADTAAGVMRVAARSIRPAPMITLGNSEPAMSHYREPVERYDRALQAVRAAIAKAEGRP